MPAGVGNAYAFQVFNTMSYTIVLSTPMLLYFKKLGASATVLGIVLALPALLNILQIPAARFVEAMGYRAFVLYGWTVRAAFVLAMAGVALLPEKIDALTRIALMLFLLFAYNASRGISLCGFLPWVTQWIPEEVRGRYVSRDQMSSALATLGDDDPGGVLFVAAGGKILLWTAFFRQFSHSDHQPLVFAPHSRCARAAASKSPERVPYKEMLLYPPFLQIAGLQRGLPCRPGGQRRVLDPDASRLIRGD